MALRYGGALLVHAAFVTFTDNPKDYFFDPFLGAADGVSSVYEDLTEPYEPTSSKVNNEVMGVVFQCGAALRRRAVGGALPPPVRA